MFLHKLHKKNENIDFIRPLLHIVMKRCISDAGEHALMCLILYGVDSKSETYRAMSLYVPAAANDPIYDITKARCGHPFCRQNSDYLIGLT